ncbi:hypothetical protein K461DRAFT_285477 [Myriangium duriaei CBS 260.36]|uniref:Uncharacterized protein n=1 Tax=Myriangium duriaei CBS 260.36 TaxID=1168546 RepID=A0A9P4MI51_9PEZI|nr:hypothetical protein K461DRAFT_285477 [Myriangium duriaei CBS 260.36]
MSAKDAHLYSVPHSKKTQSGRGISTSGSLAFSSQLSSLISSGKAQNDRPGSGRAHRQKEDIFTTHNRNSHKRAKKDLDADNTSLTQRHTADSESLDSATWHRSKRKMEEKARLYAAMKRGDVDDDESRHMVDFDRKWAENEEKGLDSRWHNESSEGSEADGEEQVEWTDEFGRTRTGTKSQMLRAQRGLKMAEEVDTRARPAAPTQIIYGDAVQSAAFNPESTIAERMADLASKRDKSLTPPPDIHFDSSREVRHKGVGFMQLSLDAQERKKQMEGLEKDRQETERKRGERERKLKERQEMLDKRRHEIEVKRSKRKADEFLEELSREIAEREAGGALDAGKAEEDT